MSLFQAGAEIVTSVLTILLTAVFGIFIIWLNGRRHEFDQMQDTEQ